MTKRTEPVAPEAPAPEVKIAEHGTAVSSETKVEDYTTEEAPRDFYDKPVKTTKTEMAGGSILEEYI